MLSVLQLWRFIESTLIAGVRAIGGFLHFTPERKMHAMNMYHARLHQKYFKYKEGKMHYSPLSYKMPSPSLILCYHGYRILSLVMQTQRYVLQSPVNREVAPLT